MAERLLPDIPHCIVCGYPEFAPFEDGNTTFEICPCCGAQSGYTYTTDEKNPHLIGVRADWFNNVYGNWWSPVDAPPKGFDAKTQLKAAGIPVPATRPPQTKQAKL